MKQFFIPMLIFMTLGCQRINENPTNDDGKIGGKSMATEHLSEKECRESTVLSPHFNQGFVKAVMCMEQDIKLGLYGREYVPGLLKDPSLNIPIERYAYLKGFQVGTNMLSDALIDGFIKHDEWKSRK